MDIVLGFDDRDGFAARLVQEPKVAVTVDGGQESVPLQAVPAHDAPLVVAVCTQRVRNLEDGAGLMFMLENLPQGICRTSAAHMQASLGAVLCRRYAKACR